MSNLNPDPDCAQCGGTGWWQYDDIHSTVCAMCCKHDQGWWLLSENYAGFKAGANNLCCRAGCGTMQRNLEEYNDSE